MERILITGGAGYKGIKVTEGFLKQGYKVTVLDNFMYGYEPILHLIQNENLEVVTHDIRNEIGQLKDFDVIVHLAGISGHPACAENSHSAKHINVDATRLLVKGLSKNQLIVNASTTFFYGNPGVVCTEEKQVDPVGNYGVTKYEAERIVGEHSNSINLRFATVFGCSPKMRVDLMVNDFVYKAVNERCVVLFDGCSRRPFIHVSDAAECYLFAVQNRDKMKGKVYNVGGENLNYSKLEVAENIQKYIDFKTIDSGVRDNDTRDFIISFNRIKKLGFIPKKTLDDGISELIKTFKFYKYHSHYRVI